MAKKQITKTITLSEPITVGDNEVTELTMRRCLVRDRLEAQRAAGPDATSGEIEVTLFGLLCDVPSEEIMDMPDGDYELLMEAYRFLKVSRPQVPKLEAESEI
ncbi:phage tail assembly protein [Oceanidesulfovibrio marinus]|uniref:Phage tail assembly protein n=1 Tax=Oceanidesulfovibrio marinus TaxID=370038 RepID=A0ABX6NHW5_9BACT|nr:phage tail assembly protein [Oceanidesulfovibrio marinus]QJT10230.1 phage tail assembly protein [Oceanidesulfovibrio marinus]